MDTSNHSSKAHRVYWLTRPGQRLAAYLDYCEKMPSMDTSIQFAETPAFPPEQHDDDRPETNLERLYRELKQALDDMKAAGWLDVVGYQSARQRYDKIKDRIWHLENDPDDDDADDEGGTVRIYDDDLESPDLDDDEPEEE